jgi:hypothetical protein
MDDMSGGQAVALRNPGVARGAATERPALREQFRPGGSMNGTVDTTPTQQRWIRGIDDSVHVERGDVGVKGDKLGWHRERGRW